MEFMPKRLLDGESLWTSSKLAMVEPPEFRAEFANLLPLATANGTFEADARLIWSRVYAFNRPDVSLERIEQILKEFERVDLVRFWQDESRKVWGFWVGIHRPGRLPPASRIDRKHERVGPDPPKEILNKPTVDQWLADGSLGLGFGLGSGKGCSGSKNRNPRSRSTQKRMELEGFADFWREYPRKVGKGAAEKAFRQIHPDTNLLTVMVRAIQVQKNSVQWRKDNGDFIPYPATWLTQRRWEDECPGANIRILKPSLE